MRDEMSGKNYVDWKDMWGMGARRLIAPPMLATDYSFGIISDAV